MNEILNGTPIKDWENRKVYFEQGKYMPHEKTVPGVNACSNGLEVKIDNSQMKPETYAKLREFIGLKEKCKLKAYGGVWKLYLQYRRDY